MKGRRVAVIGAGIAGVVAADELQKRGFDVVVYEKEGRVGGRMSTRSKDGLVFNGGATLLSENYSLLKQYSIELGIPWTPMKPGSTHRVLRSGVSYLFDMKGALDVLRLKILSFGARVRFLIWLARLAVTKFPGDFFNLSSAQNSLGVQTAGHLIREKSHREVEEYIADPFMGALHFHRADEASASLLLLLLKTMIGNKDFSARYPAGGVQRIPEALAKKFRVVLSADVRAVEPEGSKVALFIAGKKELFDSVVFACPAPVARKLIVRPTQQQEKLFSAVRYASTITVSFRVPADFFSDQTHCIYVPFVENEIVSSCIFEGRKGVELIKNRTTLFNVYLWDSAARQMMGLQDSEIVSKIEKELLGICAEFAKRRKEVTFHDIDRWECAMPVFSPELLETVRSFETHGQGENGIYFAGDYMNSPWTEGAARSGQRVARRVSENLL